MAWTWTVGATRAIAETLVPSSFKRRIGQKAAAVAALVLMLASVTKAAAALPDGPAPAKGGVALLVTASAYDGNPLDSHAGCSASAHLISDRLSRDHYDIVDARDLPRSEIVNAIATFSDKLHAMAQPRTFVYLCGYAGSVRGRLFLLPAFHAATGIIRLETDGILVQQLVELVADTNGTFIADLDTIPNHPPLTADVGETLRRSVPSSMRVDVLVHGYRAIGAEGRDYATSGVADHGNLEEARSVALLRQAMTDVPAALPAPAVPRLSMLGPPPGGRRPAPWSAPIKASAPMKAPAPPPPVVAVTKAVKMQPRPAVVAQATKPQDAHNRPRRTRNAASIIPVKVVAAPASATAGHRPARAPTRLAQRAKALAARQALHRRQMALYRARSAPTLLDLLLGNTPAPMKRRRVAGLSLRSSH